MKSFKEFIANEKKYEQILCEWNCYSLIPGTRNSYREDPENSSTRTQRHLAVYAKPNGKGKELYAVNIDGTGHDGSRGFRIPKKHAAHFREKGYNIPENRILESMDLVSIDRSQFSLVFTYNEDYELQLLVESEK